MRTKQFFALLALFTWTSLSVSPSHTSAPTSPPDEASKVKSTAPASEMSSLLTEIFKAREAREQALAEQLKKPEPDAEFQENMRLRVFKVFADPKDRQAAIELKFRSWQGSAVVVINPTTGIPTVVSCAHLLVTHDQSAFIEASFGAAIKALAIEPTWNDPDERLAITIRDYSGREFPCRLLRASSQTDVAMFTIENWQTLSPETITPTIGRVDEGAWVVLCDSIDSMPQMKCARVGDFALSVATSFGSLANQFKVETPMHHGASGGPVFNDAGELVGICSNSDTKSHMHFAHWANIERLLASP